MDINLLCRLCAKEDRLCIQVFGPEGQKQAVAKKIRLCMPIIVKESDEFPKQICLSCLSNLDTSYELYKRCLEAQSIIKNLMSVNKRTRGEIVRVYSRQEMLDMAKELREKMCTKPTAMRLGNTMYTVQGARSRAKASGNKLRVMKRKEAAAQAAGRSVMYPVGQQYMLMPPTSMSPAVVIPSAAHHGQFASAPMPAIPQAVGLTAISTAPAVATSAPASAPQAPNVTKPGVAPSTTDTATAQRAALPGSGVTVTPTNNSETTAEPQLSSIQHAIQAFQNLSQGRIALVQPIMSKQGNSAQVIPQLPAVSSNFTLRNTTGNTSSSSVIEAQEPSAQQAPLAGKAPLQNVIPVRTNDPEQTSLITSNVTRSAPIITKRSSMSPPTCLQQSSPQAPQSGTLMIHVNQSDDDDDDSESGVYNPNPLLEDSNEEEQETSVVEKPVTVKPSESRDEANPVMGVNSGNGASGRQEKSHKCPYCKKHFPENVIFHHRKLHFRQKFFSCVMCNKNFRTEAGLETHRCAQS